MRKLKHRGLKVPGSPHGAQYQGYRSDVYIFLLTQYLENWWLPIHEIKQLSFRVCTQSLHLHQQFSQGSRQNRMVSVICELGRVLILDLSPGHRIPGHRSSGTGTKRSLWTSPLANSELEFENHCSMTLRRCDDGSQGVRSVRLGHHQSHLL